MTALPYALSYAEGAKLTEKPQLRSFNCIPKPGTTNPREREGKYVLETKKSI